MTKKLYTRDELERMDVDVLDRWAFGVAGDDVVTLTPEEIHIRYHCDLGNPEHRFSQEGMAWARSVDLSEPIEVSVDHGGRYQLEDGHHRWFAAGKTGRKLTAHVEIKGNPINRILMFQEAGTLGAMPGSEFSEEQEISVPAKVPLRKNRSHR